MPYVAHGSVRVGGLGPDRRSMEPGQKISPHGILAQPDANLGRSGLPAETMAQPPAKRQPVFTTIAELRPDTSGHNLTVKVRATKRSPPRITHTLAAPLCRNFAAVSDTIFGGVAALQIQGYRYRKRKYNANGGSPARYLACGTHTGKKNAQSARVHEG